MSTSTFAKGQIYCTLLDCLLIPCYLCVRVTQALLMGSFSVANAFAFAPNFQKGVAAATKMFKLLHRVPKVRDLVDEDGGQYWVIK